MIEAEIRSWVRQYLARILGVPERDIKLDCTLDAYGLDSVEAVLMAGELEDALGVEIDPAAFLQFPTIEGMVAALERGDGLQQLLNYVAPNPA